MSDKVSQMAARLVRLLGIIATAGAVACGSPRGSGPDLLLVTIDTLRADALACYGGEADVGSAICNLAKGGVRYRWAFSTAPSTSPAIASLLTSSYPHEHGFLQFASSKLSNDALTLAEVLHSAGYTTAAIVSNPVLISSRNLDQGFDLYDDRMSVQERHRPGNRERLADATSEAALRWIETAPSPWFLWVHYQDPHGPYEAPGLPTPSDRPGGKRLRKLSDHSGRGGIPAYQEIPGVFTLEAYAQGYRDEIRYADRSLARLVAAVEGRGRPVAIAVTSDHGEAFGEDGHYLAHGHSLGLDQIRVPLLWKPAVATEAAVVGAPVSLVDVAPTLLAAAGVEIPGSFRGRPLPVETSEGPDSRILYAEQHLRAAIISGNRYYARDRDRIRALTQDRISGGVVHGLPARVALLGDGDGMPRYQPAHMQQGSAALEKLLAEFIERAPATPEPPQRELPGELRPQLEALGYLE